MITILTWVSIITGGLLILMLILSILGGLDIDFDLDSGSADGVDGGGGDLGVVKGMLTFLSVTSWVIKILMLDNSHIGAAIAIGIMCGALALWLLNYIFKALLRNEVNVNWKMEDALFKTGTVYLRIPNNGKNGIITLDINGANRELKAKTKSNEEIQTGATIMVTEVEKDFVWVEVDKH